MSDTPVTPTAHATEPEAAVVEVAHPYRSDAPVPTDACDHDWELAYKNPGQKRFVHVCSECGMKKHTDAGKESIGVHAPWVHPKHVETFEAALRAPKVETPAEYHARLYREALTARAQ